MAEIAVPVERLPHGADLPLPACASPHSSGLDLLAAVDPDEGLALAPGAVVAVPTGLRLALPEGIEAQVRPRRGLALRHGVTVLNSPGTIDSDYRGEVRVILVNHGCEPFRIARGMRIAQLVLAPVLRCRWEEGAVDPQATSRGALGFGSTGMTQEAAEAAAKEQPC